MLQIRPATLQDVEAMSTIFFKSFHPVSEYMQQAFPNTPVVQEWWKQVYTAGINDPDATLMVVTDPEKNGEITALEIWRTYKDENQHHRIEESRAQHNPLADAGTFGYVPLTSDHNQEYVNAAIGFMIKTHKQYVGDKPHIMIELVATVHERKGVGAGRLMVEKVCEEADREGLDVFVVTNGRIVPFYQKFGFVLKNTIAMPGGLGYEENVLIRKARPKTT